MKDFNRNGSKSIPEQRWRGRRGSSQNISLSIFNLLGSMTSRLIFSFNLTGAQIRSVSWFYVRTHKKSHRNIPSNCHSVVKMPNGHTIVWIYSFSPFKFLHKWHVCVMMLTTIRAGIGRPCQQDVECRPRSADDGQDGRCHQGDPHCGGRHDHGDHDSWRSLCSSWNLEMTKNYVKDNERQYFPSKLKPILSVRDQMLKLSSRPQVEDDGTAIAEAVRNVMNLTFDPIGKQPFFVGMAKMCHQVSSNHIGYC